MMRSDDAKDARELYQVEMVEYRHTQTNAEKTLYQ